MKSTFSNPFSMLPIPDQIAQEHSKQLQILLHEYIAKHQGWIPFTKYMETVLYHPQLGYYSGHTIKFGEAGDFITAPELTPLFIQTLTPSIVQWLQQSANQLLEFGAGSGRLAAQLLNACAALGHEPPTYFILELSSILRTRQQQILEQFAPQWVRHVQWLDQLPENFSGVMLGNEVLDAMPVHLFRKHRGIFFERGVSYLNNQLVFSEQPAESTFNNYLTTLEQRLNMPFSEGYSSEVNLNAPAFINSLGQCLKRGVILLIDYGFPAIEYYHPQRDQGTLMCHYRHYAHADPFFYPGLQDITAHVDFSELAAAAITNGLELVGYTSQARGLINAGILQLATQFSHSLEENFRNSRRTTQALHTLLAESEMGELFKIIAFSKGSELATSPATLFSSGQRYL